jgi:hypothetical protein
MKHLAECRQRFVRGDDRGALLQVALADDPEEHIRGIGCVALIAELVDDEHMRMQIGFERFFQPAALCGVGKLSDQLVRGGEASLEAVLDRSIGDGHPEMRFSSPRWTGENGASAFTDQLRPQQGAEHLQADRVLEGEVEFLDGPEEGKLRLSDRPGDPGLGPVGDLLADENLEKVALAHAFSLSPESEVRVQTPDGRQVEPLQHGVEVVQGRGGAHEATSWAASRTTYSAP